MNLAVTTETIVRHLSQGHTVQSLSGISAHWSGNWNRVLKWCVRHKATLWIVNYEKKSVHRNNRKSLNYMAVINLNSAVRATRFSQQCCWRFKSSGVWYCVAGCTVPTILQTHNAFFFRVKQSMKMKELWSFETPGATQPTNSITFHSIHYTHLSTHHYYHHITITWPSKDVQSLFWLTES